MSDSRKQELPRGYRVRRTPRQGREVPINLERIMMRAVSDQAFRELLFEDPVKAAAAGSYDLKGTERALLAAMDRATLEAMVRRFEAPRARHSGFTKGVAAAMAGSMIISVSACGDEPTRGVGPDPPDGTTDSTDPVMDDHVDVSPAGIYPDLPDVVEEPADDGLDADVIVDTPHDGSWGALPDMPEDVEEDD
jgi:hypothetical protein